MCLLLIIHVPSLYVYLLKICSFHRLLKSPSKIFLTKHFMYFYVYVSAQMFVMHHVHAWYPQRIEEDMGSTGNSYRQPRASHTCSAYGGQKKVPDSQHWCYRGL